MVPGFSGWQDIKGLFRKDRTELLEASWDIFGGGVTGSGFLRF
jgi:hypothetical protein